MNIFCGVVWACIDSELYSGVECCRDLVVDFFSFFWLVLGCVAFSPYFVHSVRDSLSDGQGEFVGCGGWYVEGGEELGE